MQLTGHREVTAAAVREFLAEYKREKSRPGFVGDQLHSVHHFESAPLATYEKSLASYAQERDIIDVLNLGHWSNFAQKGHFMRRFDGQSNYEAYTEACNYIRDNALAFAKAAVIGNGSSQLLSLGHACHAVEDSFTPSHAARDFGGGEQHPGPIIHIKMYAGEDAKGHGEGDAKWWDPVQETLSLQGRLAKNAVKALLKLVFDEVCDARKKGTKQIGALSGWRMYQEKWLKASPKMSKSRDQAYDLIDNYYSGFVWGNTNHALSFDETGLANAIYTKLGTETRKVSEVFHRLDEYHTTDADDVAYYYVDRLRNEKPPRVSLAVGHDRELVQLLIRVLDEGWTTSGEEECIDYLKGLTSSN